MAIISTSDYQKRLAGGESPQTVINSLRTKPKRTAGLSGSGGGYSVSLPRISTSGGSGTGTGTGGSGSGSGNPLTVTAKPSPEMQAAIEAWKKREAELKTAAGTVDPNLQAQIDAYKERLSKDTTQRDIDRATSAARSMAAGMGAKADIEGSSRGLGPGMGAGGIGEAAQRYAAKSAADITSAREKALDQLVLGGQGIMSAPGQRELAYQNLLNQSYGQNPYLDTAKLGLSQQDLALQAWIAQQNANLRNRELDSSNTLQLYRYIYGS
jgi:hypothetical protein